MLNNNIDEQWKEIKEYEGIYEISNTGKVRNAVTQKIRKTFYSRTGYECIDLNKEGYKRKYTIHRLVAIHFISNPEDKREVNHIDENKANNLYSNLEWCSSRENKQHSIKSGKYNKIYLTRNSLGKKHLPNNHSKYHNVSYDISRNKWTACIRDKGKNLLPKRFNTEKEAALHVNYIIDLYNLTDRPKNII